MSAGTIEGNRDEIDLSVWWLMLLVSAGSHAAELTVNLTDSQGAPVAGAVVFLESAAAGAVTAAGTHVLIAIKGQKLKSPHQGEGALSV